MIVKVREKWECRQAGEVLFRVVLPDGNGYLAWADKYPELGDEIRGYIAYNVDPFRNVGRPPCVCVS